MLCPYCGSTNKPTATECACCKTLLLSDPNILAKGTQLAGETYRVEKLIGQGGFGITYQVTDIHLERTVAIKEFFPFGCRRRGTTVTPSSSMNPIDYQQSKEKFIEEARTLAKFQHPGIVDVYSYFEENNTAYMVMEFLKGKTLLRLVEEKGMLSERETISYAKSVCEALSVIHQANFLHRDIKPDNIMVTDDGRVVLIDFGAARAFGASKKSATMTAIVTEGYAPFEQYLGHAKFGPYTDIYALGATLYHLLAGQAPISSLARTDPNYKVELLSVRKLNPKVSKRVAQAVTKAMAIHIDQRPQSIHEFLNLLALRPTQIPDLDTDLKHHPQHTNKTFERNQAPRLDSRIPRRFRKGLRGITRSLESEQRFSGQKIVDYLGFILEIHDQWGNLVEQIPVEMCSKKIAGALLLNDGDEVIVNGRKVRQGFIKAKSIYVLSTKTMIEPK